MAGRPAHRLLAIDIGGTKIRAGVVKLDAAAGSRETPPSIGHVLQVPTPAQEGPDAVVAAAVGLGDRVREGAGLPVVAVGIASAGVIDAATGRVTHATDALPGWPGTELAPRLGSALGLPASALNDVHAHGLGEALYGIGREHRRVLTVAVGTGISGAMVADGAVDAGSRGVAGHVGHVPSPEAGDLACSCGRVGHLEAIASGPAIAALHARLAGRAPGRAASSPTTADIAASAAKGDPISASALRTAAFATGRAIGGLLNVLDPDAVALTGGVASSGPIWWEALRAGVRHDAMDAVSGTPVLPASAGDHAALLGAARAALDRLRGAL